MSHHTECSDYHPGECCCVCKHHYALGGHPWVNGISILHIVGWVCVMPLSEGEKRYTHLAKPHGWCEMFEFAGSESPGIKEQRACQDSWPCKPVSAMEARRAEGMGKAVTGHEEGIMLEDADLLELERLLRLYRNDAVDRSEFDKRESLRFDVAFELESRGIVPWMHERKTD